MAATRASWLVGPGSIVLASASAARKRVCSFDSCSRYASAPVGRHRSRFAHIADRRTRCRFHDEATLGGVSGRRLNNRWRADVAGGERSRPALRTSGFRPTSPVCVAVPLARANRSATQTAVVGVGAYDRRHHEDDRSVRGRLTRSTGRDHRPRPRRHRRDHTAAPGMGPCADHRPGNQRGGIDAVGRAPRHGHRHIERSNWICSSHASSCPAALPCRRHSTW